MCDAGVSKARLVITAVTVQGLSQAEAARRYGLSQAWVSPLVARYRVEGEAAFEPRSRRPRTFPTATPGPVVAAVLAERDRLLASGHDAGPETIVWHLQRAGVHAPSRATIARVLTRHGRVVPAPKKKPKGAYRRFAAEQPNECWQSDVTHVRLADGSEVEVITWLDDHSRMALHVSAHPRVTGAIVVDTFRAAVAEHGCPASTLTDNGMVSPPSTPCREVPRRSGTPHNACGAAGTRSSTSSPRSAFSRRTAAGTTPRPRARSNASNRP